jgi:aryl-alcohol dehydrogenase-like predicted oxidoreductase
MSQKITTASGNPMTIAGFGCMSLGTEERSAISLLEEAFEKGINFFDTANIYDDGLNETIVGKAFKNKRADVIIATKAGNERQPDGSLKWNPARKYILQEAEKSLKRLQTDYIDLYQLHGGTIDDPTDETIEAFERLKEQGKIRYYGISSIRPNVIREYVKRSNISTVMMQYSLLDRRPEEECLPLLRDNNIGVICRGGLAQGLLAGKPPKAYLDRSEDEVKAIITSIKEKIQRPLEETALQYLLAEKAVWSVITGIRTRKHLTDHLAAIGAGPLTEEEIQIIREVIPANNYTVHR